MLCGDEAVQIDNVVRPLGDGARVLWGSQCSHLGRRIRYVLQPVGPVEYLAKFVPAALLHNQPLQDFTADSRLKISIALPLFLYGSVMQYKCHKHLASLKKYTLPESGMFSNLVCPHYTCECLIYLSLVIAGAPAGLWYNKTLLSVLAFVAVNLGGTAYGTRNWYVDKFGPERVVDKWMMIPFVY